MPFANKQKQREYQRQYQRRRRAQERDGQEEEWAEERNISPAIKTAIWVTVLFALGILSILSFFNLAGPFGEYARYGLRLGFGWGEFAFPLLLFLIGFLLVKRISYEFGRWEISGVVLLFLSALGILQHGWYASDSLAAAGSGLGGGYLGWLISNPLSQLVGYWGVWVFLLGIFVVAVLIIINSYLVSQKIEEDDSDEQEAEKIETAAEPEEDSLWGRLLGRINTWRYKQKYDGQASGQTDTDAETAGVEEGGGTNEDEASKAADLEDLNELADDDIKTPPKIRRKINIPLDLLEGGKDKPSASDLEASREIIQKTLADFGIDVEMGEVSVGPTITQYTLKPAQGIKLSRITSLANDLSLALAAHPLRIEAPIPGKSLIGVEVPNRSTALVKLKDILSSSEFRNRSSNLYISLGKDVTGKCWVTDLGKMPHILIAGSTGSGKSVAINSIIISLIYQNSPDDLKLVLVDPKKVELTAYNDIPYLLTPVITEVKKVVSALKWVVAEMERRYHLLSSRGKRNIAAYNAANKKDPLPYIVFVIDELADLMSVAANEVEAAIVRLAQMARAVGIHLVLATQRPSVNVLTGLIKANIPSRMAFVVPSQIDSRTILDTSGAEKLLGRGDMLFISPDLGKPRRLQGAFLSDNEIERVVNFLKEQGGETEYQEDVTEQFNNNASRRWGYDGADNEDELYNDAKQEVVRAGKASASLLQRRLRVGYSRAARLLDLLEAEGVIGPAEGAKPRDILVSSDGPDVEGYGYKQEDESDASRYNNQ